MGTTDAFLVLKWDRPLTELPRFADVASHPTFEADRRGPWWVFGIDYADVGLELEQEPVESLGPLVQETGAPAMVLYCYDSGTVSVTGLSKEYGAWRTCMHRESMRGYREFAGECEPFDEVFLDVPQSVHFAQLWAHAAGTVPDAGRIGDVLTKHTLFAEDLIDELLDALGLPARQPAG